MTINKCDSIAGKTYNAYVFVSNHCSIIKGDGCGIIKYMCTNDLSITSTVDDLFQERCGNDQKVIKDVKELSLDIEFSTTRVPNNSMLMQFGNMVSKTDITSVSKSEVIVINAGSWSLDPTKNMPIPINMRNSDGSMPTYNITGTVDGALTDGTDFEGTQITETTPEGADVKFNFVELKAANVGDNNITTLDQNLEITVTYTPASTTDISIKTGAFDSFEVQIDIFAVNIDDNSDIIHITTTGVYNKFAKIINMGKNTEAPEDQTVGFKIEKGNYLDIKGISINECIK